MTKLRIRSMPRIALVEVILAPLAPAVLSAACGDSGSGAEAGAEEDCAALIAEANDAPPIPICNEDPTEGGGIDLEGAYLVGDLKYPIPGRVTSVNPAQVGMWSELIETPAHLSIHSIHRPTGAFLQFGADDDGSGTYWDEDKSVWWPPAECSPYSDGDLSSCELDRDVYPGGPPDSAHADVPATFDSEPANLFCSGHVNVPPWNSLEAQTLPLTITIGGTLPEGGNNGIGDKLVFAEDLPDVNPGANPVEGDFEWTQIDVSTPRWYPTVTTLADERMLVTGGTAVTSVTCVRDGQQVEGLACACASCTDGCVLMPGIHPSTCVCDPSASAVDDCEIKERPTVTWSSSSAKEATTGRLPRFQTSSRILPTRTTIHSPSCFRTL